jgi:polar amino acid transport system substrate-binding protein
MNVMRSMLVIAALAAALGQSATAVAQSSPETSYARVERTKVLRLGVIAGAVPYFSKDLVSGQWSGFGVDFGNSLATSLGAKVQFVETTWGNSVLDLQSNKIDAMFGLAPSPARRVTVDFSDTLFVNTYTTVCKKGYPEKTWEQLNTPDTKLSVDIGSSHDQLATKILPNATVQRLEDSGAATLALQTGRVDCQILVILLAQPLLAKRPDLGHMSIPTPEYSASVNIGLRKDTDPAMREAVNKWLTATRANGEVKSVILKNMQQLAGVPPSAFPPNIKF